MAKKSKNSKSMSNSKLLFLSIALLFIIIEALFILKNNQQTVQSNSLQQNVAGTSDVK